MTTLTIRNRKAIASPVIRMMDSNGQDLTDVYNGDGEYIALYIISKDETPPIKYEWEKKLGNGNWEVRNENIVDTVQERNEDGENKYRLKITYERGKIKYSNELLYRKHSVQISWYDENNDLLTQEIQDKTGLNNTVTVGSRENLIFEYKNYYVGEWKTISARQNTPNEFLVVIPLENLNVTEIRAYKEVGGRRIYSNILRYTRTEEVTNCQEFTIYSGLGRGIDITYTDCEGKEVHLTIPPDGGAERGDDRVEQSVVIKAVPGTISGEYGSIY